MFSVFGAPDSDEEDEREEGLEEEEVEEEGFLSLPNETIGRIFTNLGIADRLNAAMVCRRFNEAEKKGKYYTRKLNIEMEIRFYHPSFRKRALFPEDGIEYKYHLLNTFEDFSCLERVFGHTSFGAVHVHFHEERPVYRRLIELIRDCDAEELSMEIEDRNGSLGDAADYDSLLLNLLSNRRVVVFKSHRKARLLEQGWSSVYQAIRSGSLSSLESLEIHGYACRFVLESMGLHLWDPLNPESIWSPRPEEFEVFEDALNEFIIYHGQIRIRLPSGFAPCPESIYFSIYDDEEKMKEDKQEIRDRDDAVRKRVHKLI